MSRQELEAINGRASPALMAGKATMSWRNAELRVALDMKMKPLHRLFRSNKATPLVYQLSESDSGRRIKLRVGDRIEVRLPGNPSTGYEWEVVLPVASCVKLMKETEYIPDSAAFGSGGEHLFVFEPVTAGETTVRLIYSRSWERNASPVASFEFIVVARSVKSKK